jgi:rhodanese-related sulfurtransferase
MSTLEPVRTKRLATTIKRSGVNATDIGGGFQAWRAAGLPVEPNSAALDEQHT